MRWGIRERVLLPLLVLLLAIVGFGLFTALTSARLAEQRIVNQLDRLGRTLTESRFPLTAAVLEQLRGLSGAHFRLERIDGSRLATLPAALAWEPELPSPNPDDSLGPPVTIEEIPYRTRLISLPSDDPTRSGRLTIFFPDEEFRRAIADAIRPSLLLGGLAGVGALLAAGVVGQQVVQRIRLLERRTRVIADGDFRPMPIPGPADEIRDLAASINEMAARLAQLQETIRRSERMRLLGEVSGGLAHQLRNAVTGARLAVQVHVSELPHASDEALDVAIRQLDLMESHLRRFFELGNGEEGRCEPCDLVAILHESIDLIAPQAKHARIHIQLNLPSSMPIFGDAGQIRHLFLNLLGNAMDAVGTDGEVEFIGQTSERGHRLECWDNGPGPSAQVADKLFEPFVTGKAQGVGLGLAVAQQIVRTHGGRLDWRRDANRTCFWLELPLAGGSSRSRSGQTEFRIAEPVPQSNESIQIKS
ncbi:sensor histidine kinase [Tuwongella immobilis]|uniref:histidine kinase n=1 Tax=Tuwongella immobilis TaxID=692036 RepID=A0A6C2YMS7_9BACT|nr:HAMP domain-containing sensor histidine kinase [Tuwongella immobilis]VIP02898.1 integral membrane sensor signal transduction histidine kinase : Histidine kinase OS=Planctomyces maris DSM 8797 GN=PM8797T_07689 PE=4 SV=1: HAMP: HATPase_c [Tuwongella immobilis]VTS02782.1 integral membrane sensor signal transduction histidine kinase : Histidine kinase OS=Planctomyces maris DSM 8797 GN=PM8797T_07689 PE=4 SV=1: HAMP: HATPase_c [Tuwongella immobilis]